MLIFSAELNFLPPPKTNRYLQAQNGKRFIPKRIKEAIDDTVYLLRNLKKITIKEPCQLYIKYTLPDRRRRDLDNLNKTLQDCLEKAGVVQDDDLFRRIIMEKVIIKGAEKVEIYIYTLSQNFVLEPIGDMDV